MNNNIFKNFFKYLLRKLNRKIIKIKRKTPQSFVHDIPNKEIVDSIINSKGIIHIGAHRGSEGIVYEWFNKKVVWIEANPLIFDDLRDNISNLYGQIAFNNLLGEENKSNVQFYLSNNDYASSSVFEFSDNLIEKIKFNEKKIIMEKKIYLNMITLDSLIDKKKIDISNFDHWIIDAQGSELQILKGAKNNLKYCKSLYVEVSKDEYYKGESTKWPELRDYLTNNNFKLTSEPSSSHCDVLFVRN